MAGIARDNLIQCPKCGMLFYVHEYHQCPNTVRRDQERRRIHQTRRHNNSNKDGVLNMTIREIDRRLSALEQAGNGNGIPEIVIYGEDGELIKGNQRLTT